jgi:glycyl-tRNA synthetase beta chain
VTIRDADSYAQQLESEGAVIAGFAARRAEIEKQLKAAAAQEGLQPIDDDALLDEVTALVERPNVLSCQFEQEFLDVPQECLILTMKANQKYFPLLEATGRLTNKFLDRQQHPGPPTLRRSIGGNERVVRPRLADAKLLLRPGPQEVADGNAHPGPGQGGLSQQARYPGRARRARRNCWHAPNRRKARWLNVDWPTRPTAPPCWPRPTCVTDMVGEFPELQGIMGRYYALHDGEFGRGRRRHRGPLQAAFRRRRTAANGDVGLLRRAGRQAADPGRTCSASASCPPAIKRSLRPASPRAGG